MKIVDKLKKVPLCSLEYGTVFRALDKDDSLQLFMKIYPVVGEKKIINAIDLRNGDLYAFCESGLVGTVDCELVIK